MRNGKYDVLSPLYSGEPVNEAEVLGAAVWLWMHPPCIVMRHCIPCR